MSNKRSVGLSEDLIVGAALAHADLHGMGSLTMRKLAVALGTAPMSLYHYVSSRAKLVDLMVERVFAEIDTPPQGAHWKAAMRERCVSARAVLSRHPWAPPLMESREEPGPESLRHHNAVIGCFREAGFSLPLTAHAYAILDSFVYGFALEEANLPGDTEEAYQPIIDQISRQIEESGFIHLAELTRDHVLQPGYSFGSSFEFGLDLILDGLERALRQEI